MMYSEAAVCEYLREEIFPQISPPPYGEIEMVRLANQKPVYLFIERTNNIMVIGKLFLCDSVLPDEAWLLAEKEYLNLRLLRERFGMSENGDTVVAPLGESRELSALLITERALGQTLDYYIAKAIYEQRRDELFEKLGYLARFLVKLHQNSENERTVSSDLPGSYLDKMLNFLSEQTLSLTEIRNIEKHADRWLNKKDIFDSDREVIVHGDATPTNFLFNNGDVTAIDLEKMKWADRCWDLGFVVAELKHHFMWRMGDGWVAEPFIGHFLWEYAVNHGNAQFFHIITCKTPLYMAIGLLRIARNTWLDEPYRQRLLKEAELCLEYGP